LKFDAYNWFCVYKVYVCLSQRLLETGAYLKCFRNMGAEMLNSRLIDYYAFGRMVNN